MKYILFVIMSTLYLQNQWTANFHLRLCRKWNSLFTLAPRRRRGDNEQAAEAPNIWNNDEQTGPNSSASQKCLSNNRKPPSMITLTGHCYLKKEQEKRDERSDV